MAERTGAAQRKTKETQVEVRVDLDGTGKAEIDCGVPFLAHMLEQIARHGMIDLQISASGDTWIDDHHSVEDIGITLGQALSLAWGDKSGVSRYGHAYVPLDESLARAVIDLSGRAGLEYQADFPRERVGALDTELIEEFFRALAFNASLTAHLDVLRGRNAHHMAEALFKAFGRALRSAVELDPRAAGLVPSTKGAL
ncbi:imidazoleglycerol-phosphate dehydratase HisB [Halorhodospira halochloris]|uniref:imidazoleglycerol-phosphate dehydratase HisB n=1 Tax=Halorhodospira halochloris TaxID=1052 RepID=UPI001EE93EA7|nr:imidazoleglycerol-phosphate dehydratase HisB [Halorhodospira halochloris]MCG5530942.1 imidazoleglycerol-phosphate dehydratase HisB [Halorhodospira halochloris]MCG5549161.1 imidazoleglycerol-phosphate dehydratase HisB [Halorhodospira halochloris]